MQIVLLLLVALGALAGPRADACVVVPDPPIVAVPSPVPRDAAFDPDDPDAASAPLRSIRYPGEAAIWRGVAAELPETVEPSPRLLGAAAARPRPDPAVSDSIVRLFCALFDRRPDDFELTYWVARYRAGLPLVTIAEAFVGADEYLARRGSDAVEDVVAGLYLDALGRTPPPDAVAALARRVRDGETSLGSVIVSFTESPTYVARTATASPRKPPLPYPAVGSGKRILYSDSEQRVWLVSDTGELVKTHLVSGRRGVPGVGRYRVYSKSRYAWAPYDGITMEYMVRFARGEWPYGFHSIPIYPDRRPLQTKAQLGTHRSGGCVRQDWEDAEFLFRWAEIGTRVIVVP